MNAQARRVVAVAGSALALAAGVATAEVPTYRVDVIATYDVVTAIRGASEAGHVVGWRSEIGMVMPFVATIDDGLSVLPLPPGYLTGAALDVNSSGVIVGTVADNTFPFDLGEPAIWTPDGAGGYTVTVPEQFDFVPSPLGGLSAVEGGQAVAINEGGTIIGWSRHQGFVGGPATEFSLSGAPVNLRELGFEATPTDINNNNVAVGNNLLFDCSTMTATSLGTPTDFGGSPIGFVYGRAVNDSSEVVAYASLLTADHNIWITYLHDGAAWAPLDPAQLPTRFVGPVYDNNNRGDVSASGGVLFKDEGVLVGGFDGLLDPAFAQWDTDLGYINNDRRVFTTAVDGTTGQSAIVVLTPLNAGCSVADLAEPFGQLDFSDVVAFLSAFGAMGDAADIAEPFGQWDFSDVVAFLGAFGAGCP